MSMADNPVVLELAAQIVSAHVANNAVAVDQLPKLINDVHRALFSAGQASAKPEKEPAVPINKSVLANHLVCLECGKHFSMLKRHLATDHLLTPEQYRQKWNLRSSYPIVAPNYAKTRSALARKFGLGRKAPMKAGAKRNAAR
jgi:predicted transcriptional regulator